MWLIALTACGSLGLQSIELGESTEGRITIRPAGTVNFGRVVEDGEPEDETLTLTVNGGEVRVVDIWIDGRSGAFSLLSDPPVPRTMEAGSEMDVRVRFQPGASGNYSAELLVETAGGTLVSRDLKGEGCSDRDNNGRCD
ncbi:MAG: hypothetical protein FJ102_07450 [Deltaproteobacteria bacterium]|nr:hypothetical protein [Deltaproteobacteria bacterium]